MKKEERQELELLDFRAVAKQKQNEVFEKLMRHVSLGADDISLDGIKLFLEYVIGKPPVETRNVNTNTHDVKVYATKEQRDAAVQAYLKVDE